MTVASNEVERIREALPDLREQVRVGMFKKQGHTWSFGECADMIETLLAHSDPRPVAEGLREAATDEQLKDAVTEMLSHRGERPYRILRGGYALWEAWLPAFRAALRYLLSTHNPAPMAGEVLLPIKPTQAMREAATEIDIDTITSRPTRLNWDEADAIYAAMLAAHPSTQEGADRE